MHSYGGLKDLKSSLVTPFLFPLRMPSSPCLFLLQCPSFSKLGDEDMTTLDTTKNIAYMHICQVIFSANVAPIIRVVRYPTSVLIILIIRKDKVWYGMKAYDVM